MRDGHAITLCFGIVMAATGCSDSAARVVRPALAAQAGPTVTPTDAPASPPRLEEQACAGVGRAQRAACPFLEPVALKVIPNGIRVHVDPSNAEAILARMRCHLAFTRAHPREPVEDCPLFLPGVEIAVAVDGEAVEVTSANATTARELVDRALGAYGR